MLESSLKNTNFVFWCSLVGYKQDLENNTIDTNLSSSSIIEFSEWEIVKAIRKSITHDIKQDINLMINMKTIIDSTLDKLQNSQEIFINHFAVVKPPVERLFSTPPLQLSIAVLSMVRVITISLPSLNTL